jgi:hypothetical protein
LILARIDLMIKVGGSEMRVRNIMCAALLAASLCSILPAQWPLRPSCSINSVKGTWAFAELGWTVPAGSGSSAVASPVIGIGAFSIDNLGKMSGSGTTISAVGIAGTPIPAGEVLDFDFTGTVDITPDCTGLLKYSIQLKGTGAPLPGQFIERFVYSPFKDELISMSIQSPLSRRCPTDS